MSTISLQTGIPNETSPKPPQLSAELRLQATKKTVPQSDTAQLSTPAALQAAFQDVQQRNCALQKKWFAFMDSLLDSDEGSPSTHSTEPMNEKRAATTVFGFFKALAQNLQQGLHLAEQAKTQHGMSQFEYRISPEDKPVVFQFDPQLPHEKEVSGCLNQQVQALEAHAPASNEFVKAVQA